MVPKSSFYRSIKTAFYSAGNRSQTVFDGSCGRSRKTDLQEIDVRKCPKE